MAISESQLETWSHQGSVAQSRDTYAYIKGVLESSSSPYASRSFTTFLQGSYGNDTNVYSDSDVDIVIQLNETYYSDTMALGEIQKASFDRAFISATYSLHEFSADVTSWLRRNFGSNVMLGAKAVRINGLESRRNADVLICTNFRRYRSDSNGTDDRYHEGVCFFQADGYRIENFPKQHASNCTAKHQATNGLFKPTVRIWKNLRNRMVEERFIPDKLAPSYFIEGLLYNVPNENFSGSYADIFAAAFNWIYSANRSNLLCANELFYLLNDTLPVTWQATKLEQFLSAVRARWNSW